MIVMINGVEIDSEDPKVISKALAKAKREEAAKEKQDQADRDTARLRARDHGYRILAMKARGDLLPHSYYYPRGHNWAHHLFRPLPDGFQWLGADPPAKVYCDPITGAVCDAGGFLMLVFLCHPHDGITRAFAVGVCGSQWCFEECPGITPEDFHAHKD